MVHDQWNWDNHSSDFTVMKRLFTILFILCLLPGMGWAEGTIDKIAAASGNFISGRAVTATLYVSPNGNDLDGSSWDNAYTTIQAALDAASTDADDLTQIMIAPHSTYYDIATTGDPTWTGNYELVGSHRLVRARTSFSTKGRGLARVCIVQVQAGRWISGWKCRNFSWFRVFFRSGWRGTNNLKDR